jgi:hypothetical protein
MVEVAAAPHQLATRAAPAALSLPARHAGAYVAGAAHIQEEPSGRAQEQFQRRPPFDYHGVHGRQINKQRGCQQELGNLSARVGRLAILVVAVRPSPFHR